jgi:uncharacterized protein (TIGR00369 family)
VGYFPSQWTVIFALLIALEKARMANSTETNPATDTRAAKGPVISVAQFRDLVAKELPVADQMGFDVIAIDYGKARAVAKYQTKFLRPGGTIAGPVMMSLADYVSYAAVLSVAGPVKLAVTTNMSVSFLRKPVPTDLIADARILDWSQRVAVAEIDIYSDGDDRMVARSSCIYAIPDTEIHGD